MTFLRQHAHDTNISTVQLGVTDLSRCNTLCQLFSLCPYFVPLDSQYSTIFKLHLQHTSKMLISGIWAQKQTGQIGICQSTYVVDIKNLLAQLFLLQ